ncbi:magnesium transporter [candidate division FCPU426 bacterium]|nr:magnesium transporter [candidate division FCPU426 bacterium]
MRTLELNHLKIEAVRKELTQLLKTGDAIAIKQLVADLHPMDAARVTALLRESERLYLFQLLNSDVAADIVERLSDNDQVDVVSALQPEVASDIIGQMDSDDAADVLSELPQDKTDAILAVMPKNRAVQTRRLIAYAEDTAGGMMATEFVALKETLTVGQALITLREKYSRVGDERAAYVYTCGAKGMLTGVMQLRNLVLRPPQEKLKNLKIDNVIYLDVNMSKHEVARIFRRHRYLALPVVDNARRLVGVITSDDVVDLIQEITTEEMMKLQGVSTDETRSLPVLKMARRRVSWLSINIFLNIIAASVIAFYTDTLKAVIALAVFLPIISDMSGVSGMQAVAVSIRDLALERTTPKEIWSVLGKEVRIGLLNGFILGAEIGIVAYLWKGLPYLGLVAAVSLWLNTIISVCLGGSLPLLLKRYKLDPAIASGPLLTTITDLMGFFIVLSLATYWLSYLK